MKFFGKLVCAISLLVFMSFSVVALDAKVISVSGKVEVQDGGNWVAVKVGDILKKGDVVSTGFKSSVDLQINDASITLGALTRMTVQQLASSNQKDETSLFLDSGKISADVQHKEKRVSFKVTTPVVTASVRGSSGDFYVDSVDVTGGSWVVSVSDQSEPVIASEDVVSDYLPAEGTSTVFTSVSDISGDYGKPVYAGQSVKVEDNSITSPQSELTVMTQPTSFNGTLSAVEGERNPIAEITSSTLPPTDLEKESSISIDIGW